MISSRYGLARPLFIVAVALVALPLASAPCRAQGTTASDVESARELFAQGRALRAQGDMRGALQKFAAAHALGRTPITGLELARTHAALAQPVEAREVCLGIARTPVTREETGRSKEAREEAAKLAEAMKPKIATLSVVLEVAAPQERASLSVKIDDAEVQIAGLAEGRKLNPGKHTVVARIGEGPEERSEVTLSEGETATVKLTLKAAPKARKPPPNEGPSVLVEETRMSPLVPVGFVVAGVGLGVGVITGVLALGKKGDLVCLGGECKTSADVTNLTNARTLADVSTAGFVVGGIGAAVGVVGLLMPRKIQVRRGGVFLQPYMAGTEAGVHGTF